MKIDDITMAVASSAYVSMPNHKALANLQARFETARLSEDRERTLRIHRMLRPIKALSSIAAATALPWALVLDDIYMEEKQPLRLSYLLAARRACKEAFLLQKLTVKTVKQCQAALDEIAGFIGDGDEPYFINTRLSRLALHRKLSMLGVAPRWRGDELSINIKSGHVKKEIQADNWLIDLEWICARRNLNWMPKKLLMLPKGVYPSWKHSLVTFDLLSTEDIVHYQWSLSKKIIKLALGSGFERELIAIVSKETKAEMKKLDRASAKARERMIEDAVDIPQLKNADIDRRMGYWMAAALGDASLASTVRYHRMMTGEERAPQSVSEMLTKINRYLV